LAPSGLFHFYLFHRRNAKKYVYYSYHFDFFLLSIAGLKISDSGNYMCKAGSETGETTMSAKLIVECKHLLPLVLTNDQRIRMESSSCIC
jgi:hypothetical protein